MVTVTELNRAPDGRFESLEATQELSAQGQQIYVQDTQPSNPDKGDVWLDTTEAFK